MRGNECRGHNTVKAAIERHTVMLCQNHTDRCLPRQTGTTKNLHTWGDGKKQVHLYATDTDRRQQCWWHLCLLCHLCPVWHPRHQVTMPDPNVPKSSIYRPDLRIHILLFPVLSSLLLMHMPWIASTIWILIQIFGMMKENPLVSTLSAVWKCSWHTFWRPEQHIERTCMWRQQLIERNRIWECITIYN